MGSTAPGISSAAAAVAPPPSAAAAVSCPASPVTPPAPAPAAAAVQGSSRGGTRGGVTSGRGEPRSGLTTAPVHTSHPVFYLVSLPEIKFMA